MDTENFIVERARLQERLTARRSQRLDSFPMGMLEDYGMKTPPWAKLALSFISRGSVLSRFLEVGLPLAAPFLLSAKAPLFNKLIQRFFSRKS